MTFHDSITRGPVSFVRNVDVNRQIPVQIAHPRNTLFSWKPVTAAARTCSQEFAFPVEVVCFLETVARFLCRESLGCPVEKNNQTMNLAKKTHQKCTDTTKRLQIFPFFWFSKHFPAATHRNNNVCCAENNRETVFTLMVMFLRSVSSKTACNFLLISSDRSRVMDPSCWCMLYSEAMIPVFLASAACKRKEMAGKTRKELLAAEFLHKLCGRQSEQKTCS